MIAREPEPERIAFPLQSDASLSYQVEDDSLTNIGAMISNAFEIVRDPEPVGHTLHDARILLQCRNGVDVGQHRHDVLANQMVAHIDHVVLMPDSARRTCVALFKGMQHTLEQVVCLLSQLNQP